jgi:hypothetical protein
MKHQENTVQNTLATVRGDHGTSPCSPISILLLVFLMASLMTVSGCIGLSGSQTPPPPSKPLSTGNSSTSTAPVVTSQPSSVNVAIGQTATFSVGVSGTAPMTYQWAKNGAAISGANAASYTTPATASGDNGTSFSVTVTNAAGTAISNNATLGVSNAPTQAKGNLSANPPSLNFGSINVGNNGSLTTTLSNSGSANLTVNNVNLAGPGYTVNGVWTGQTIAPGQSVNVSIGLTPFATGSIPGVLVVTSDASDSTLSITMAGTGAQAVSHEATLQWGASQSTVTGYNVYRATSPGAEKGTTAINGSSEIGGTQFTDSNVTAGATYYYVVTSVNSSGMESAFSNEISGTIP